MSDTTADKHLFLVLADYALDVCNIESVAINPSMPLWSHVINASWSLTLNRSNRTHEGIPPFAFMVFRDGFPVSCADPTGWTTAGDANCVGEAIRDVIATATSAAQANRVVGA